MASLRAKYYQALNDFHPALFMGLFMIALSWSFMTNAPWEPLVWFNAELQRISNGVLGMSPSTWSLLMLIFAGIILYKRPTASGLLIASWPVLFLGAIATYYALAIQASPTFGVWVIGGYLSLIFVNVAANKYNESETARRVLAAKLVESVGAVRDGQSAVQ